MKGLKHTRALHYTMFCIALILVISGVLMLAQTFTHYNELFLQRQDRQLQDMVQAADENIAITINNLQEDFDYILQRRGFMLAESEWTETGETEDLLFRMQENLIAQHPLIKAMLAIRNGEILLSTDGVMNYYFPSGWNGELQPCFAGDGTMYLALFNATADVQYAALIDVSAWYANLTRIIDSDNSRLLLLGSRERILLHHWLGENLVTAVEELICRWEIPEILPMEGMAALIGELKDAGYGIYLLSNAFARQHEYWPRVPGSEYFDDTFISADVKLVKPQREIYEMALDKFGVTAEECVFIDDLPSNIEMGENCGICGVVFHGDVEILRADLRRAGVKI